jgi:hypothetical protein
LVKGAAESEHIQELKDASQNQLPYRQKCNVSETRQIKMTAPALQPDAMYFQKHRKHCHKTKGWMSLQNLEGTKQGSQTASSSHFRDLDRQRDSNMLVISISPKDGIWCSAGCLQPQAQTEPLLACGYQLGPLLSHDAHASHILASKRVQTSGAVEVTMRLS